jgi:hypothetical protein
MKEILTRILKLIGEQQKDSARLFADTLALEAVMTAMGPEFKSLLEEQVKVTRDRVETIVLHPQTIVFEALEKEVANMPDDGHSTALANADFHAEMYATTKRVEAMIELKKQADQKIAMEEEARSKQFVPLSGPVNEAAAFLIPGVSPGC